jgi:pimeloyl-ACP methyl ester carboxylesterase
MPPPDLKYARTDTLEIAYEHSGPSEAAPIFLLHGFPYDPRAYDAMVPRLVQAGYRTIVPYLRGYGATRFRKDETPRSGQQAALAHDLLELTDALKIERAAHVGYDWGGRAACVLAALAPQRVRCLVSQGGYNIHDIPGSVTPDGEADGIQPAGNSLRHAPKFTGFYERRTIARAGHNLPQEVPEFVCKATLDLLART